MDYEKRENVKVVLKLTSLPVNHLSTSGLGGSGGEREQPTEPGETSSTVLLLLQHFAAEVVRQKTTRIR